MVDREMPLIRDTVQVDKEKFTRLFMETKDAVKKRNVKKEVGNVAPGTVIDGTNNGGIILARIKIWFATFFTN